MMNFFRPILKTRVTAAVLILFIIVAVPFLSADSYYVVAPAFAQEDAPHRVFRGDEPDPELDGVASNNSNLRVEAVFEGLEFPTSMAFLGENDILVLEKNTGKVQRIIDGVLQGEPVLDLQVANNDERGLLGIAIMNVTGGDGNNSTGGTFVDAVVLNGTTSNNNTQLAGVSSSATTTTYVFLYFAESGGGEDGDDWQERREPMGNRLYRYVLEGNRLVDGELLLDLPATPGPRYNGGPVVVGPDGNVYVVIGDVDHHETQTQNYEDGPDPDLTSGVLRITPDGQAVNNSKGIIGEGSVLGLYYAYGMRQSFGMDFDPVTGTLWDTENGPETRDEINMMEPGFNSGWADVQGMVASQDSFDEEEDLVDFNGRGKYSDPEFVWHRTVAPTAIKFLDSTKLGAQYENDLFVGDFKNGFLYRFDLNGERTGLVLNGALADRVAEDTDDNGELRNVIFGTGFGGITDIEVGPDGYLYVLSYHENEGAIFRILPEGIDDESRGNEDNSGDDESSDDEESNNDDEAANDNDDGSFEIQQ